MRARLLLCAVLWAFPALAALTTVTQTIKDPNGALFNGTLEIRLNAPCTEAGGARVYPTPKIVTVTGGTFAITLYPNTTCVPAQTSYTVTYRPRGGGPQRLEYWIVGTTSPTTIDQVATSIVPTPSFTIGLSQLAPGGAGVGQILRWNGSNWAPTDLTGVSVTSVFGRTGVVVKQAGDYSFSDISGTAVVGQLPAAGGDLSGTLAAATVAKLQGRSVYSGAPSDGNVLAWNASQTRWQPSLNLGVPDATGHADKVLSNNGSTPDWRALGGDISGAPATVTVAKVQGQLWSTSAPSDGNVPVWSTSTTRWVPTAFTGLPTQAGQAGKFARTDGATASWSNIDSLQGRPVSSTAPSVNYVLGWTGSTWAPKVDATGAALPSMTGNANKIPTNDGTDAWWATLSGDLLGGTYAAGALPVTVQGIQGRPVDSAAPFDGQVLRWVAANQDWEPQDPPGASGGEQNTASNVGSAGTGLFKQKSVVDLQFYKIHSANSLLTVALSGTDYLDLTVNEGSLNLGNQTGTAGPTHGGTGITSWTLGDLMYSSGTDVLVKLPGNTSTTRKILSQTGTGSGSAAIVWDTLVAGDLPDTYQSTSQKDVASGYAGLDASTKLAASQLPNPGASSLGGVEAKTCSGTDKVSAIGTDGVPVCSTDGGGAGWGSITSQPQYLTAEQYGAVGNCTADDTTPLQNLLNAIAGTGKTGILSQCYKITAGLTATSGNFTLTGGGTIKPVVGGSTNINMLHIYGSTSTVTGSATSYSKTTRATTTNATFDVDSPTGFSIGDYVNVLFNDGTVTYAQQGIIKNIASNTFTLNSPILIPLAAADTNGITKFIPVTNVYVHHLNFDASGSTTTGYTRGIFLDVAAFCKLEALDFVGFHGGSGTTSSAVTAYWGYANTVSHIRARNSGSSAEAVFALGYQTASQYDDLTTIDGGAGAFGFLSYFGVLNHGRGLTSINSPGRGFKTTGAAWSNFSDLDIIGGGSTGLHLQGGTYRCTFSNVRSLRNAEDNVSLGGDDSEYNFLNGVVALNAGNGVEFVTNTSDSLNTVRDMYAAPGNIQNTTNNMALLGQPFTAFANLNAATPGAVPGCSADLTVTMTGSGVAVGDVVTVSAPVAMPANFTLQGFVSATGTVKIRWCQLAGTAADPDSGGGNYRVMVTKNVGF